MFTRGCPHGGVVLRLQHGLPLAGRPASSRLEPAAALARLTGSSQHRPGVAKTGSSLALLLFSSCSLGPRSHPTPSLSRGSLLFQTPHPLTMHMTFLVSMGDRLMEDGCSVGVWSGAPVLSLITQQVCIIADRFFLHRGKLMLAKVSCPASHSELWILHLSTYCRVSL